jgi:hypothetical protein
MQVLREGDTGDLVTQWQNFLVGLGLELCSTGEFDAVTTDSTKMFQKNNGLVADGVVGRGTWAKAVFLGFGEMTDAQPDQASPAFPPKPDFPALSAQGRAEVFGAFSFKPAPTDSNPEGIQLLDDWAKKNLVSVVVPQLVGVPGAPSDGKVLFHRLAAGQLVSLFQAWDDAGLMGRVLSWAGSYAPRFIRGSRTVLSNHAYASAFDINATWNGLGKEPALVGQRGSVRLLVPLANEHGFFWGGHFPNRPDGMHFEVAKVL